MRRLTGRQLRVRGPRIVGLLGCSLAILSAHDAVAQSAPTLPSGERVTAGDATVARNGAGALTVHQSTSAAIIAWNDFSIGTGGAVRFENGAGATLNRVDGPAMSRLDGSLTATGSVYLVNPRGVVVGRNGVVNVGGGFVASTLDIDDRTFLAGGEQTFAGPSRAAVVNLGRVGALGGDVALIATEVRNEGRMDATAGAAGLLAGSRVLMRDVETDQGRFAVLLGTSGDSATNTGAINAATAELRAAGGSVYALAGNITGIARADDFQVIGGRILLTAGDGGTVRVGNARLAATADQVTGSIEATGSVIDVASGAVLDVSGTSLAGQILLTAADRLRFAGNTLARAPDQGGDVILTAPVIDLTGGNVDTRGATTGTLQLYQPNIVVDGSLGGAIGRNLRTSNVALYAAADLFGGAPEEGDITVAAPLTTTGRNLLTLAARDALRFDQNVTVVSGAMLDLSAAAGDGGANISFAPNRSLTFTGAAGAGQALAINGNAYTLIYNLADLRAIATDPAASYALARSISAGGTALAGPVAGGQGGDSFAGQFEGLGHSINGLRIDAPGKSRVGLFGSVTGAIRNVALVGGSVVGGSSVGALVGSLNQGTIARVSSSVSVTARGSSPGGVVGGLVGSVYLGTVADSSSSGIVSAAGAVQVGGLVGSAYGTTITGSAATGDVTGGDGTGGLAGGISRASVENSYASGNVSGTRDVGGLIGVASYGGGADGSRASGRVSGQENVGGLVGRLLSASATNSTASGAVSASVGNGGGLVGTSSDGVVEHASASGRVTGGGNLGGLLGSVDTMFVSDVSATGAVTATVSGAGGLVGRAASSSIQSAVASGEVRGVNAVGGLLGGSTSVTIRDVVAGGRVDGTQGVGTDVGGLIGRSERDDIASARAQNNVRGRENVGGLIGHRAGGTLNDVTATGPVSGTRNVGPLIGLDDPAP